LDVTAPPALRVAIWAKVFCRIGSGVDASSALYPFAKLHPDPITISQLGNGQHAIALMRRASLL